MKATSAASEVKKKSRSNSDARVAIGEIDKKLKVIIGDDLPVLRKLKKFVIESGGKRIRPLTHYYALRMLGSKSEEWKDVGAIGELIHNASLLHDDVVDESDMRRGKPSARIIYGNKTVILAGDYLLACGLRHLSTLKRSRQLLVLFSNVIRLLSEGELIQMHHEGNLEIPVVAYERIIYCKTACLFGAMTESSALLAEKTERELARYREFGERLGRYFQVRDDVIDYFSPEVESGKKSYQDFERGLITWPVIRLRESLGRSGKDELRKIWKNRTSGKKRMLGLIADMGIRDSSMKYLADELDGLLTFVNGHAPSDARETLSSNLSQLAMS